MTLHDKGGGGVRQKIICMTRRVGGLTKSVFFPSKSGMFLFNFLHNLAKN